MTIPERTTDRLCLRGWRSSDVADLHRILEQPGILRYFPNPNPPSLQQVKQLIEGQVEHWRGHGFGWWAVKECASGMLIGWSGLQYLPETDEVEIGYLLGKPYWGRGLATEGGRVGLAFAFQDLSMTEIVGIVHPENVASQRVLVKLGLDFTARAVYFGMDCLRYAIRQDRYRPQPDEGPPFRSDM